MTYRAIGLMSGSSLDGLDIAFVEFNESGGRWSYDIKAADCFEYSNEWVEKLKNAVTLSAYDYQLLHASYGKYIGEQVNKFIDAQGLHHQVQLIASHGHTTFHVPHAGMTGQLGDGAAIAATTEINVVSDLRALDVAFGGQGAPIVPIGEKLLLGDYSYFLNVGGIANISFNDPNGYIAFDVCAANRVLNMLSQQEGKEYDAGGEMASSGKIDVQLLTKLNELAYYEKPYPKSLPNSFGIEEVFPLVKSFNLSTSDALRTYVEHIAVQIANSLQAIGVERAENKKLLVTGGGALNTFLISRLQQILQGLNIEVVVPDALLVNYKEALVMALIGVLRWREEYNVLSTVTGARRSSIGGAVWIGQEA
ncbi:MAG TPA: anhydro-N-acetylmuramic acid kinase [Segetibacter sp.]|jgi:anhydro-N-acetylmuramic acid kinase